MKIGQLGDILFEVSDQTIQTIRDMTWSGQASTGTHKLHLKKALTEFTGAEPETITFNMRVTKALSGDPKSVLNTLRNYIKNGKTVTLILSGSKQGTSWLVTKFKATVKNYDKKGAISDIDFSITLTEY
ncbi:MAG: phage tail protein [Ruminococcus sp.]|nr:phage tail protein [Ruminococcus sp.]